MAHKGRCCQNGVNISPIGVLLIYVLEVVGGIGRGTGLPLDHITEGARCTCYITVGMRWESWTSLHLGYNV